MSSKKIHTDTIKEWLKQDAGCKWTQDKNNPNIFTSSHLEAVYVYDNNIRYFEDVRASYLSKSVDLPESIDEFYKILGRKGYNVFFKLGSILREVV